MQTEDMATGARAAVRHVLGGTMQLELDEPIVEYLAR